MSARCGLRLQLNAALTPRRRSGGVDSGCCQTSQPANHTATPTGDMKLLALHNVKVGQQLLATLVVKYKSFE